MEGRMGGYGTMSVGFIGTGSMGGMLVRTLVRYGGLNPDRVWAANRSPGKLEQLAHAVPGMHTGTGAQVAKNCRTVFICVKPQETPTVLEEIGPQLTPDHLLVTISNLIEMAGIAERVPARVSKVIPSVAQEVGGGVILLMPGPRTRPEDLAAMDHLLSGCGRVVVIEESQGRICADLTSCGPAFIAYILREMAHAAADFRPDLDSAACDTLVRETLLATARLLTESGLDFDDVIRRVAVPGGITAEGLQTLSAHLPTAFARLFAVTHEMEETKKGRMRL